MKRFFYRLDLTLTSDGGVLDPVLPGVARPGQPSQPDAIPVVGLGNEPWLPGASLAGAFREHLVDSEVPSALVDRLMGAGGASTTPSRVRVLGGFWRGAAGPAYESIQSTAIDRRRGAARSSTLRTIRVLAAGASFRTYWEADDLAEEEQQAMLDALSTWRPLIGRAVTSGYGETATSNLAWGVLDTSTEPDLERLLTLSGPSLVNAVATRTLPVREGTAREAVRLLLDIVAPLHVGYGEMDGNRNLIRRRDSRYVVPGQSLRGVLRSRIDHILASVGAPSCVSQNCRCLSCEIFGAVDDVSGRRARVRVADALIDDAAKGEIEHVAIDRFTGGARDSALYSDEVVIAGRLTVRVEDLTASSLLWRRTAALLRLVVEDMNRGYVVLGGSGQRGYGRVRYVSRPDDGLPDLGEAQRVLWEHLAEAEVSG